MSTKQKWKNEQYKASKEFDFAAPGSAKERMAKIKFTVATKALKELEKDRKRRDKAVNKKK